MQVESFLARYPPFSALPGDDLHRIAGSVQFARGERAESLVNYERAIQAAFREVDDALISSEKFTEQLAAQDQTVAAERARLELSLLRYEAGVSSYSDVLDAQRSLFSSELILAQLRGARLAAIAQLYRALGGGWVRSRLAGGSG